MFYAQSTRERDRQTDRRRQRQREFCNDSNDFGFIFVGVSNFICTFLKESPGTIELSVRHKKIY